MLGRDWNIVAMAAVLVLFAIVIWVSLLVLPACGLVGGAFARWNYCETPLIADPDEAETLDLRRADLESRIEALQRELVLRQCEPVLPQQTRDPNAPEVDEDQWNQRSLDVLDGCWELDYSVQIRHVETNQIIEFDDWTICFRAGGDGVGTQVMRSTDGAICEGDIPGRFNSQGQLVLEEPANLACTGGFEIFRRIMTCDRTAVGGLSCSMYQPRGGGTDQFRMSRQ